MTAALGNKLNVCDRFGRQSLDRHGRRVQTLSQIFCDVPDKRTARTRQHKGVPRTTTPCWKNDEILGEKLRLVRNR